MKDASHTHPKAIQIHHGRLMRGCTAADREKAA